MAKRKATVPRPIYNKRPCKECDHIKKLYDGGELCINGVCGYTDRIEPLHGAWYCIHFTSNGARMHPKVRHKGKKRRKK